MKNFIALLALVCPLMLAAGCGGHSGGNVTESAEMSEIEKYMAEEAKDQAAMDASLDAKGK